MLKKWVANGEYMVIDDYLMVNHDYWLIVDSH